MFDFKDIYKMDVADNILFAKRNIIDNIYSESRLEGIAVTFPDTYEIYEGRTVAGLSIDDTLKVVNLKRAWTFLLDSVEYPLDLRYVRQLNQEIGDRIVFQAGSLRTSTVKIGGTSYVPEIPNSDVAGKDIYNILHQNKSTTEKALELMLYLMRSQLFMDGNKRTAQLAANQIMIQGGAGIITIPVKYQATFLSMLVTYYETSNNENIKKFLYEHAIQGVSAPSVVKDDETPICKEEFIGYTNTKKKPSLNPIISGKKP